MGRGEGCAFLFLGAGGGRGSQSTVESRKCERPELQREGSTITPEDLVLMLNMGWSLQDLAALASVDVKAVEEMIVAQVQRERLEAGF